MDPVRSLARDKVASPEDLGGATSNGMNKTIPLVILVVLVLAGLATFFFISPRNSEDTLPSPTATVTPDSGVSNLIRLENPKPNQLVKSPLNLVGEARGNWYFEASFPARIYDANGVEIGLVVVQADGEWMTEEFVKFNTVFNFKKPTTETGTLVLYKDNPSGLPENDAELRVPVRFDLAGWTQNSLSESCKVAGCSGQLCVDASEEDIATTCEYKEEYACYKTAKCELQETGQCGWTPTEGLVACLQAAWQAEAESQVY